MKEGAKPIVKWAGGKGNALPQLFRLFPKEFKSYHEPMIGGGAAFFSLKPDKASINDINDALINLYSWVRDDVEKVIKGLHRVEAEYIALDDAGQQEYFYKKRSKYNEIKRDTLKSAVTFMFLNRTCFNGLYRENRKGEFNVPRGRYKNPRICDEENLREVSNYLQNTTISHGSYKYVLKSAKKGDFVYFDPPYVPLTVTSSFTSYSASDFDTEDQVELAHVFAKLDGLGCYVALSNSNTPLVRELYKKYKKHTIQASRNINAKGDGRSKIKELLITNY